MGNACQTQRIAQKESSSVEAPPKPESGWHCWQCNKLNVAGDRKCQVCGVGPKFVCADGSGGNANSEKVQESCSGRVLRPRDASGRVLRPTGGEVRIPEE